LTSTALEEKSQQTIDRREESPIDFLFFFFIVIL
jgi:hypothetical protein